ncbi:MAG: 2-amino-4-hydroxy-6-hydroxymethyldihydropteridine diphosphokinase [Gemmatimonadota bacterium]|nr:2-amino-4-hydroxy-6-hydroxymethyldihydropteridine diphosphokinase [Gemmatimonadota bacterium]
MALSYIGMGANLDDRADALRRAAATLDEHDSLDVKAASPVYETAPIGVTAQPMFLNAVLAAETDLDPLALLECLLAVERRFGRVRGQRWGPRLLDLDILLYGNEVFQSRGLEIPHPRLHERAFVLVPLCELTPRGRHPLFNRTFSELAESIVPTQEVRKLDGVSLLSACR